MSILNGYCSRCGGALEATTIWVPRMHVIPPPFEGCSPTYISGPEMDPYHPNCVAGSKTEPDAIRKMLEHFEAPPAPPFQSYTTV